MTRRLLLTFMNYPERVDRERTNQVAVTLMLRDAIGQPWPLALSADCLRFIGRYRRLEAFDIDATLLFEGIRKVG